MMSVEPKRSRGRPRDPAKLEAILDAAYDLFVDRGIAATPMDLVAERAGVSKMTVYANFRDKPALLAAVFMPSVFVRSSQTASVSLSASVWRSLCRSHFRPSHSSPPRSTPA